MNTFRQYLSSDPSLRVSNITDDITDLTTLPELLSYRALHQPHEVVFTFLQDGEVEADSLTYLELEQQALMIAARLQASRIKPGQCVLLLYPPGLDFIAGFFGCLYAGVIAVPVNPPRRNQKMNRLQAIGLDAEAVAVLTTAVFSQSIVDRFRDVPSLAGLQWITTDTLNDIADRYQNVAITPDSLAFLQYTSGSTATPKGVMVSHQNLLHNSADLDYGLEHTPGSRMVTWLPTFHDMGLIYGVIQPIYAGIACIMMAPAAFMQKPIRWLQAISTYRATHSAAPNFAYDLCVQRTTAEERSTLDLSCWQVALNGAERIHPKTLDQFVETFASYGFRRRVFSPGYGLAEATLKVTTVDKLVPLAYYTVQEVPLTQNRVVAATIGEVDNQCNLVSCGRPALGTQLVIVDPDRLVPCAPDEVGEVWVTGKGVAQGYWQRPEETAQTFHAHLTGDDRSFLRTGDLGFLKDGELFITGRQKDLIVMRGANHYPDDIEMTVGQCHSAIRSWFTAAFSVEVAGQERLVVVQEIERTHLRHLNVDEVTGAIRRSVAEQHGLQVYAVVLLKTNSIPKTSSGKIQRRACRTAFLEQSLDTVGIRLLDESSAESVQATLPRDVLLKNLMNDRCAQLKADMQSLEAKIRNRIGH